MVEKPTPKSSLGNKELDQAEKQFEAFDHNIKEMTLDRMNKAPAPDLEPQTKIAQKDLEKMKDIYLTPKRTISSREKFNERFREEYEFAKEYVYFYAENKEIIGEKTTFWTKSYPGLPAEEWDVPVNTPLWAPRYVAERIKGCKYHRLVMKERSLGADNMGSYYGEMAADSIVQRLDAIPATKQRSVFMGAKHF